MIRSTIKIAFRNIRRSFGFSLINLAGLALGLTACFLIFLWVRDELSFDRYHEKASRIYRVMDEVLVDGVGEKSASMAFPVGETLREEYPGEIESSVRFFNFKSPSLLVEYGNTGKKRFNEPRFFFADDTVFDIFSITMIDGDPSTALTQPNSVVLTEETAQKYFGKENPLGKVLRFENKADLVITGVLEDIPDNSHFKFDFLASFSSLTELVRESMRRSWMWNPCWTYILLRDGVSPESLTAKFPDFSRKYFPPSFHNDQVIKLQPLTRIHLHSHLDQEITLNSSISTVYIFSIAAVFVLVIACINYVNLTTARSMNRGKEVGIRTVSGALRSQLIRQFLGEFILLSVSAALLSMVLVRILLPAFQTFSGKTLTLNPAADGPVLGGFFLFTAFVGLISGIYPALFLSGFTPVKVLKGKIPGREKGFSLRKILVVIQFAISTILIIGADIAFKQLDFMRNKELGFSRDHVVMIRAHGANISTFYEGFKDQLLQSSKVVRVTGMDDIIGADFQTSTLLPEGSSGTKAHVVPQLTVFHDFIETFGLEIIAGRCFSKEFPSDMKEGIILNEAAAGQMGWTPEEAVGKRLEWADSMTVRVVGVVKNFNYTSLDQPVTPFMLTMPRSERHMNRVMKFIAVKVIPDGIQETIAFLRAQWETVLPDRNFEYFFLDEKLASLYSAQESMGRVFRVFSLLTTFIACLGIFALASFMAEVRTKEIGIRKALGASAFSIVYLQAKDFLKWVLAANLTAWPIAYILMKRWLHSFAYRTAVSLPVFLLTGVLTLIIASVTVSYHSIKSSLTDPVISLRHE